MDIKVIVVPAILCFVLVYSAHVILKVRVNQKKFKEWRERDAELTSAFLLATSTGDIEEAKRVHKELDILLKEYANEK